MLTFKVIDKMPKKKKTDSITIHNIKSSLYRQAHVDGAHGGITPSGFININFFSQRRAIPKGTEFEVNEDGQIAQPIKNVEGSKEGIVREFGFGAYMDINTCISLKDFLENIIKEYHAISHKK